MGTPDVDDVLRNPGRLCYGPTDLSEDWPHKGTGMGVIAEAIATPVYRYEAVSSDTYGGEAVDIIEVGGEWIFAATLREWSNDAITSFFNSAAGAVSDPAQRVVVAPTSAKPGTKVSSVVLLFTPYEQDTHPAMLMYRAIPMISEASEIRMTLQDEMVIPVIYRCLRSASNKQVKIGLLEDLVL